MSVRSYRSLFASLAVFLLLAGLASCSSPSRVSRVDDDSTEPGTPQVTGNDTDSRTEGVLPLDPAVQTATLDNGLRYMIRRNSRPEERAELRLVVNVGSILENEDQLGLAHFVEHMAFNGTTHFEKQALVEYLEGIGMRFGPDINAYTSFDETVYMLQLPTDSTEIVHTGLQILRDWAGEVAFDPEEIEKERGVVIEEWRTSRGASARIQDRQLPVLLHDSRYADRLPIGTTDILESFSHESLIGYYRDWYRPELMTVIAVGDFDVEQLESWIRELFSDLPATMAAPERVYYDVPEHDDVLYTIESDPEMTTARVDIMYKHAPWAEGTRTSYRRRLRSSLYSNMINDRLTELTQSADPPYVAAGSSDSPLVRTRSAYSLAAIVRDGDYLRAMRALLTEAERVRRFGFTQTELDRAKTDLLRGLEIAFNERDKTNSSVLASEYVRHVLSREAVPGIEYEFELAGELLPTISLQEVNELLAALVTERNQVIMISGPESETAPLPEVQDVRALFDEVTGQEIEPYVDEVDDRPLIEILPPPGSIVYESTDPGLGLTFFTLSNGIEVVLKPTDFKNDQVLLQATSPGGYSLVDDDLYMSATFASQLVGASGVGEFGPIELEKKLAGKAVQVGPTISSLSEGFSGSSAPSDLETLFQLIHLFATAPRADSVVFASYMTRLSSVLSTRHSSPQSAFSDTLSVTLNQYHYRALPLSEDLLDDIELRESMAFFRDRFADFADFRFYIVGAFEVDALRPLIETYVATLPSGGRTETWKDSGIRTPDDVVVKTVEKGIEPVSQVAIIFSGDVDWSPEARHNMYMLESVVATRLREILREDLGGTYGVSVNGSVSDRPIESYRFSISFGCSPDRVEELTDQVFATLEAIKTTPPESTYVENAREGAIRDYEVGVRENGYWMSTLQFYIERGMDPSPILTGPSAWINDLSADDVSEAARRFLDMDRYVQVTLLPESEAQ